ncbi:hypothetical protein K1719_013703 [Acacia pycnantha]|nr:hypothetical protein K1719_013703 [Acacia pycnantha]
MKNPNQRETKFESDFKIILQVPDKTLIAKSCTSEGKFQDFRLVLESNSTLHVFLLQRVSPASFLRGMYDESVPN